MLLFKTCQHGIRRGSKLRQIADLSKDWGVRMGCFKKKQAKHLQANKFFMYFGTII
jgi:hypothetical protein